MTLQELAARLQVHGIDITGKTLSRIEGQHRLVQEYELLVLAKILRVDIRWLVG